MGGGQISHTVKQNGMLMSIPSILEFPETLSQW